MEDFHFREKMMHFDHESFPERVVHARGAGAHGYFQVYESMEKYTTAGFLNDPSRRSEERRVGKECRSRRSQNRKRKKSKRRGEVIGCCERGICRKGGSE